MIILLHCLPKILPFLNPPRHFLMLSRRIGHVRNICEFCCRRRTGLELSQKKDARLQLIQVPKLRVDAKAKEKHTRVMYYGPPDNSHVPKYKAVLQKFSDSLNRNKWTREEDSNLVKGIKQQFQDMLLQKTYQNEEILRQRSTDIVSDVEGFPEDSNNFESIIASISDHDITDENIREFLPKVNWEQLASMYTKGRSGAECESRWLNFTDPLINKNSWTKTEEKKLLYIIQQKGISNWINIALSLGTNRTPFQCLAHYQRSLNPSILKREWTEDEDDKLRAAVATYGENDWQCVASVLEGRTGTQCSNRWTKSLHPMRKRKGKWVPNEDKRLKVAAMFFGAKNWKNVAHYVPGRDHVQCRERWKNCLDPSVKVDEWSEEEDVRLKEAFDEHGPSWGKIASCVSQRTDNQCLRRWKTLFPHEVPRLKAARRIRKVALISNFVDREARRPALGPSDFVQLQLLDSVPETEKIDPCEKGKRKSSYVAKLRSAKRKADAERSCGEGVLRLTNGKKRHSNAKKSSRRDPVTASVQKKVSEVTNVDKPPAHDVHTARKKAPGRKRNKSRIPASRQAATEVDEHASKPSSCENEGVDTMNKEVGSQSEVDATKKRRARKQFHRKNKLMEQVTEAQVHTGTDGIDVNKKSDAPEPCLSEHSDLPISGNRLPSPRSSPGRMLNGDVAEPFVRDNSEERPPRCSTPDILDNLNSRAFTVSRKVAVDRPRRKGRTSKHMQTAEYEDDMTLASFINQSRRAKKILLSSTKASTLMWCK
ncbi:cell division cycle 5-like protein [Heracleum sosnowskyi]|uniref:Cell division cycle 5-like protein n=1 Tax=Heracleum sosnowskyi TaxID=360622 RepID=A0AAD8GXL9_9APIA|nr:cell division cycle 5-like protein [Heracleum sosnowskyi]